MADYETIQRRRNIVVGIFVIVGLTALGWLIYKFGELPSMVSRINSFRIFVQFPNASGVQEDTPVNFCGYQIGRVIKVMRPTKRYDKIRDLYYYQTVGVLSIDGRYVDIPSNVDPKLMRRGLGSSFIDLKYDPNEPLEPLDPNSPESVYLTDGAVLQGETGMTSEFFPEESQEKLENLVGKITTLVDHANKIIGSPDNQKNLKTILANLSEVTEQATKSLEAFKQLSSTGRTTLENADKSIEELVSSMVETSDQLGKMSSELRLILTKINNGQGSASQFVNDGKLYESMLENSQQMGKLLEEIENFIKKSTDKGLPLKLK